MTIKIKLDIKVCKHTHTHTKKKNGCTPNVRVVIRVETGTDFATRVPDVHYPTGTRVLVFCFDATMAGKHVLHSTISRPTVIRTDVTLQHTSRPSLLLSLQCKAMIVFCKHRIQLESFLREIMGCVP